MREKLNGGRRLHAFLSRLTIHRLTLLMKRRAMRKTAKQVFPTPTQSGRIKLLHACWFSRNGERKKKSIRVNHNWYTSFGGLRNKTPLKRDKFEHSCISSHSRSSRRLADITHSLAAINQSPLCSEKLGEARARATSNNEIIKNHLCVLKHNLCRLAQIVARNKSPFISRLTHVRVLSLPLCVVGALAQESVSFRATTLASLSLSLSLSASLVLRYTRTCTFDHRPLARSLSRSSA